MGILDLQRAACAPQRWENLVRDNSMAAENFTPNLSRRMPEAVDLLELRGIYELTLIPGGRYILGAGFRSEDHGSPVSVVLLDLGLPGRPLLPNPPIVSRYEIDCPMGYTRQSLRVTAAIDFAGDSALEVVVLVQPTPNFYALHRPNFNCM
jgi:hypothetical protein